MWLCMWKLTISEEILIWFLDYFNIFALCEQFWKIRILGPLLRQKGSPLGPLFAKNWVPFLQFLGPLVIWEQCNMCNCRTSTIILACIGSDKGNVSVLHQDEGGIGKSIPDAQQISRDPRDFPRAKPEGNLEGRGKSGGQRGWISQYLPSFGGARTISQHQFL